MNLIEQLVSLTKISVPTNAEMFDHLDACSSCHIECTRTWMRDLSSVLWEVIIQEFDENSRFFVDINETFFLDLRHFCDKKMCE